jgi:MFS family permease
LPFYYGWVNLAVAALAMVGTLPGRTQGLGLITEPLIKDLHIDRLSYAQINLWATLAGSLFCLGVGRLIDRFGSRAVLSSVAGALGAVVLAMSSVKGIIWLAVLITCTRGLGQSALSVVSLTMVGKWFVRRLNSAMGIYTVALSVGFMAAFPIIGNLVHTSGWRAAWSWVGGLILFVLTPVSLILVRRSPEHCGVVLDGKKDGQEDGHEAGEDDGEEDGQKKVESANAAAITGYGATAKAGESAGVKAGYNAAAKPGYSAAAIAGHTAADINNDARITGYTLGGALRTPAFWVFALSSSLYGLIASGIALFNESILAERGFDASVYYRTLVITALTALAGNFLGGWLVGRWSMGRLMSIAMAMLSCSLLALPFITRMAHVVAYAVVMGAAGGFIIVLFFSFWSGAFGRSHLGKIQGAAQTLTVLASALGPLLLAECVTSTGSYAVSFYGLAAITGSLAVAAWFVSIPSVLPERPA